MGRRTKWIEITCKNCGKVFELPPHQAKGRKFCSKKCFQEYTHEQGSVEVTCGVCGKLFTTTLSRIEKGHGKFCSVECTNESFVLRGSTTITCITCGKEFSIWNSQLGKIKTCSPPCREKYFESKCGYDTTFLNEITPFAARFIGLVNTDGSMAMNNNAVSITSTDKSMLDQVAKATKYKNTISVRYPKPGAEINGVKIKKQKISYRINFGGRAISNKLLEYGFKPGKKSKRIEIPQCITDDIFAYFLRGTIEGDGSFSSLEKGTISCAVYSASKKCLTQIHESLQRLRIVDGGSISRNKESGVYILGFGHLDSLQIGKYIYEDNPKEDSLARKRDAWLEGRKYKIKSLPRRGKICSVDGCEESVEFKGLCKTHYDETPERQEAIERNKKKAKEWRENNKENLKLYREKNREKFAAQKREWNEKNKEKIAAQRRKRYGENREEIVAKRRVWYQENTELAKQQQKDYTARNKDKVSARNREYRENHKEEIAVNREKYYEKNKEEIKGKRREDYANKKLEKQQKDQLEKILSGDFGFSKDIKFPLDQISDQTLRGAAHAQR